MPDFDVSEAAEHQIILFMRAAFVFHHGCVTAGQHLPPFPEDHEEHRGQDEEPLQLPGRRLNMFRSNTDSCREELQLYFSGFGSFQSRLSPRLCNKVPGMFLA